MAPASFHVACIELGWEGGKPLNVSRLQSINGKLTYNATRNQSTLREAMS